MSCTAFLLPEWYVRVSIKSIAVSLSTGQATHGTRYICPIWSPVTLMAFAKCLQYLGRISLVRRHEQVKAFKAKEAFAYLTHTCSILRSSYQPIVDLKPIMMTVMRFHCSFLSKCCADQPYLYYSVTLA